MSKGQLLGRIDCPTCQTPQGMRITEDKNGDPFGFCDANCNQQYRVGGDKRRVDMFFANHPEISQGKSEEKHEAQQVPVKAEKTEIPEAASTKKSALIDALSFMAGGSK